MLPMEIFLVFHLRIRIVLMLSLNVINILWACACHIHVHAIYMCLDCIPWFLAPTRFVADVLRNVCVHDEFYNDAPSALWHSNCCPRLDGCSLHHVDNACHVDNKHLCTRLWYLWTVTCLLPWNASHYRSSLLNLLFADYEIGECVSLHDVKASRIFLLPFFCQLFIDTVLEDSASLEVLCCSVQC